MRFLLVDFLQKNRQIRTANHRAPPRQTPK